MEDKEHITGNGKCYKSHKNSEGERITGANNVWREKVSVVSAYVFSLGTWKRHKNQRSEMFSLCIIGHDICVDSSALSE